MQRLRSRAGILLVTAAAVALLSLPVVALAKGPPDVVGGGTDTAGTVVSPQANVPNPPPGQLNKPDPASKPAPRPHPKSPAETSAPAPPPAGQAPSANAPGWGHGANGHAQKRRGPKTAAPAPPVGGPASQPARDVPGSELADGSTEPSGAVEEPKPSGSPDEPEPTGALELPRADGRDTGDGAVAGAEADEIIELPEDASPDTLPFTGLQLALMSMAGLVAIAGGAALRRGVQRRRA